MKIVTFGDSPHTISGFGTALRFLDTYLHNVGHEVYHIGFQSFGQEMIASTGDTILGYKLLPNIGGKRFGEDAWKFWLPKKQPDVFLTLADFWMLIDLFRNDVEYPWCGWYPIDGYPLTDQLKEMLKKLDYRVCMSNWGAEMVRKEGFTTYHIPHGVDTSIYYPRNKKENDFTRDILGIPRKCLLLGVFGRNQDRKKHPQAIKILKKLREERPDLDIRMLLWMDRRDTEGWDMEFVVKRFGFEIGKDVFFPPTDIMPNFMYGAPSELMAEIMSCCDIKLDTTGGEGFGLTLVESLACGTLVIATDYTTPREILGDFTCGLPIKVAMYDLGNAGVDRALVDVEHGASQVLWAIEHPDETIAMTNRGVERARKIYDWGVIVKQFDEYLRDIKI